ncbi:hypothetical protein [Streptomyces sp. KR80]|uniref:hypothetical protein n=1 Tax=Streptomyces sp. KR80 TaxID=3457426 RepID=UPI003FD5F51D
MSPTPITKQHRDCPRATRRTCSAIGAYLRLSKEDINEERRERWQQTNRETPVEQQTEDEEAERGHSNGERFARLYENPGASAEERDEAGRKRRPEPSSGHATRPRRLPGAGSERPFLIVHA